MKIKILMGLMLLVLLLTGCQTELSLDDFETTNYNHPESQVLLTLPVQWSLQENSEQNVTFSDEETKILFNFYYEVGGYSYYNLNDLALLIYEKLTADLAEVELIREPQANATDLKTELVFLGTYQDQVMKNLVVVYEPVIGIRYYLVFSAPEAEYDRYESLFEDIAEEMIVPKDFLPIYPQLEADLPKENIEN